MPSQRTTIAFAIGGVLLLLIGAFSFVGFSVATHQTNVDQQASTATVGDASLSVPSEVVLYVFGFGAENEQFEQAVATALEQRGTSVRIVNHVEPVYDDPVLIVGLQEPEITYNPFTPSAAVALSFVYAPGGNVTQFGRPYDDETARFNASLLRYRLLEDEPLLFEVDDENRIFRKGKVRVTDETIGVISWPAYRTHVIETLADESVDTALSDAT